MKKFVLFLGLAFSMANWSNVYADKQVKADELPSDAKTFLTVYFSNSKIDGVVKEAQTNDFEVTTSDGKEFDFDSSGRWKSVDCNTERVPSPLVPREILNQVAKHYGPETKIIWIGRTKRLYKVELSNGVLVGFNKKFKMIPIKY